MANKRIPAVPAFTNGVDFQRGDQFVGSRAGVTGRANFGGKYVLPEYNDADIGKNLVVETANSTAWQANTAALDSIEVLFSGTRTPADITGSQIDAMFQNNRVLENYDDIVISYQYQSAQAGFIMPRIAAFPRIGVVGRALELRGGRASLVITLSNLKATIRGASAVPGATEAELPTLTKIEGIVRRGA